MKDIKRGFFWKFKFVVFVFVGKYIVGVIYFWKRNIFNY